MTPEEYERFKEAEKIHLRKLKEIKKVHAQMQRKSQVTRAVTDMASGIEDLFSEHEEMVYRLQADAAGSEARLDVALDQAHAIDPAVIIDQFRDYMQVQLAQGVRLKHMTRHLLGLYLGQPGARSYRRYLSEHMFEDDAGIEVFDRAITHRQTPNRTARYDE